MGGLRFSCLLGVLGCAAAPAQGQSLLQALAEEGKPGARRKARPASGTAVAVDHEILVEELRSVKFTGSRRGRQVFATVGVQVLVALLIAVLSHSVRWYLSPKGREARWTAQWSPRKSEVPQEEHFQTPMDVDVYGAAVSSCIRDMQVLALGSHQNADESIRAFRIVASMAMLWASILVQVFIGYMVANELSSYIVLKFRRLYDNFEMAVYKESSLTVNGNGFHRGEPQGFEPEGFARLEPEQMHTICQMPFANDLFLLTILSIWTLSCVVDLRRGLTMLMDFTVTLPTIESVKDAAVVTEGDVVIVGLPLALKLFVMCSICFPRLILDCTILYLGCRWLVATSDMGDLVLNAVALEFVLLLNSLVLQALVPAHGVQGLERTRVVSSGSKHTSAVLALLATVFWALFAASWCILYVYVLQDVLPGYLWDVRGVCTAWHQAVARSE